MHCNELGPSTLVVNTKDLLCYNWLQMISPEPQVKKTSAELTHCESDITVCQATKRPSAIDQSTRASKENLQRR